MTEDITNKPYWQTEASSAFIAGLTTPGGEAARQMGLDIQEDGEQKYPESVMNNRKTELLQNGLINFIGRGNDHLEIQNTTENQEAEMKMAGMSISEINQQLNQNGLGDLVFLASSSFAPSPKFRDKFSEQTEVDLLNEDLKMVNPPLVHDLVNSKHGFNQQMKSSLPVAPYSIVVEYSKQGTEGAEIAQEQFNIPETSLPSTTNEAVEMFYDDWEALRDIPNDVKEDGIDVLFYKAMNGSGGDNTGMWSVEEFAEDIIRDLDADLYQQDGDAEHGMGIIQLYIPHLSDIRGVAMDNELVQTYERIGPHDAPQTNFDELPDEIKNDVDRLEERGHATPIYHMDNPASVQGLQNMVDRGTQTVQQYLEQQGVEQDAIDENVGLFLGWDFAIINHEHPLFQEYPDAVQDYLTNDDFSIPAHLIRGDEHGFQSEYAENIGRFYPTVLEANISPGMKGDQVVGDPRQDTRPNLRNFMDSLSYGRDFSAGQYLED